MKTSYILLVFLFILTTIATTTLAWRSKSSSESTGISIGDRGPKRIGAGAGGDKERHKQQHHAKKNESTDDSKNETQHYNIGLIVPHTNFGKREYQRAIRYDTHTHKHILLSFHTIPLTFDGCYHQNTDNLFIYTCVCTCVGTQRAKDNSNNIRISPSGDMNMSECACMMIGLNAFDKLYFGLSYCY